MVGSALDHWDYGLAGKGVISGVGLLNEGEIEHFVEYSAIEID